MLSSDNGDFIFQKSINTRVYYVPWNSPALSWWAILFVYGVIFKNRELQRAKGKGGIGKWLRNQEQFLLWSHTVYGRCISNGTAAVIKSPKYAASQYNNLVESYVSENAAARISTSKFPQMTGSDLELVSYWLNNLSSPVPKQQVHIQKRGRMNRKTYLPLHCLYFLFTRRSFLVQFCSGNCFSFSISMSQEQESACVFSVCTERDGLCFYRALGWGLCAKFSVDHDAIFVISLCPA